MHRMRRFHCEVSCNYHLATFLRHRINYYLRFSGLSGGHTPAATIPRVSTPAPKIYTLQNYKLAFSCLIVKCENKREKSIIRQELEGIKWYSGIKCIRFNYLFKYRDYFN